MVKQIPDRCVFMFPGQGSQYVRMGEDLYKNNHRTREIFQTSCELSGKDIPQLCFKGPITNLKRTDNLQIAITSLNLSLYEALREYADIPLSTVCLGHSLGEYSALYASGVMSLKDTLMATLHRGIIMNQVSQNHPGAMYAIIGTEVSVIEDGIDRLCLQERVSIANDNSPHQQVISGDLEATGTFIQWLRSEIQSVKTIKLQVSGAWHSPLMKNCTVEFSGILDKIVFKLPERSVIMNVTGNYENNPLIMKDYLIAQIHSRVQWHRSILRLLAEGFEYYIEIGPRRVLGNLLREIAQDKFGFQYKNIETMNDLSKL